MKNTLVAILALIAIVLGGLAWSQKQRIAELEAARVAAENKAREAQRATDTTKQLLADAEKERAALQAQKARSVAPANAAPTTRRDPAAAMAVLDNPAMQRMMSASIKGSLDQRYASLFRQLRLSPTDLDKFKDLLVEKQMSAVDALRVAQSRGMTSNPAEMAGLMNKVQGEMDDSIHALLGEQGFQTFQDYNQNIASYGLLDQIERRLSYTNAPLQATQSEALLQILKTTTQPSALERAPGAGSMAGFMQTFAGGNALTASLTQRPITDATVDAAKGVLTAPQVDALRQLQTEQQSQAGAMQNVRGVLGVGGAGGTGDVRVEARVMTVPIGGATPTPAPPPKD
jgi:hypothetical protein